MARKEKYYYIAGMYNVEKGDKVATVSTSCFCVTNDDNPSGIPTMGYLVKSAKKFAKSKGEKYIEGSFYIVSIIKLTKEQYEQLTDNTELED